MIATPISSPNLSEDEIATINYLRQNNATIQDVVEYYSQKAVKDYIEKMDALTGSTLSEDEREKVMNDLLIQIGFFQHERFIHLVVTVTFAILTLSTLFACLFADNVALYI